MPEFKGSPQISAKREETAWAWTRVSSAWNVPASSHLQRETQKLRLRDCQVSFAESLSQTFYGARITPKPEKSLGPAYILEGMSNSPRPSLRDCPHNKEPACAMLFAACVPPARRIPSYHNQREQETRLLHLPHSWCVEALQMGDHSMSNFIPDFVPAMWFSRAYCLFNVNYVWSLFVFRSLEAFGRETPVDESLLLVFVILNNTCKHYVVSAHLFLQAKETWLLHPRASAIWFGTYSARKIQRLQVFH